MTHFLSPRIFQLLLPLLYGSLTLAYAQSNRKQDVVYLKNGGIMRGSILEISDDFKVKIETVGRNVFVFDRTDIERISREESRVKEENQVVLKEKGFVNMTEVGLLTGQAAMNDGGGGVFYQNSATIQTFNGYQFTPLFQTGLTAGVDWYNTFALLPVALGIRGDILRQRITPFYSLDVGYGFNWLNTASLNQQVKGGMMWNPGLGLKMRGSRNTAWIVSIGYKSQRAETSNNWGWQWTNRRFHYNRLALRTGFSF